MNKPHQFVFLPTEKQSSICLYEHKMMLLSTASLRLNNDMYRNHFLYILSDDEIKKDDYVFGNNKVFKYDGGILPFKIKKIIATTNPELHFEKSSGLKTLHPNIPPISNEPIILPDGTKLQSDIEYIISLYNGKCKEVDIDKILDNLLIERGEHPSRVRNPLYGEERKLAKDLLNQCLQDNADKKFTLDDMYGMIRFYLTKIVVERTGLDKTPIQLVDEYIQSLIKEQPKSDTVMVEYESNIDQIGSEEDELYERPKLKNGCIVVVRN